MNKNTILYLILFTLLAILLLPSCEQFSNTDDSIIDEETTAASTTTSAPTTTASPTTTAAPTTKNEGFIIPWWVKLIFCGLFCFMSNDN